MSAFDIRPMEPGDWAEVADLIYVSTNYWYRANGKSAIFSGEPGSTRLFCEVYEDLDPGCCLLAVSAETGRVAGSCFYHIRETHVSLGIMNAHPNYAGQGVARRLLSAIISIADAEGKPLRLVSSAMNLDSFSLYTRAGFVPQRAYQDMVVSAPAGGWAVPHSNQVRTATLDDLPAILALEEELAGIRRERDYRYFLENRTGIWHVSVMEASDGRLDGFLASVAHPASNLLGPGAARREERAAALIAAELARRPGWTAVVLVPVQCSALVSQMYAWGARNCELHFHQVRGQWVAPKGACLPTFMPETA